MINFLDVKTPSQGEAAVVRSDYGLENHGLSNLGMVFWNLALAKDDRREELLARLANKLPDDQALEFRALASDMVNRHRAMFPTMHR